MPIQSKQQPPYYSQQSAIKQYVALLTQTGTNAPTAIELINTTGATMTFLREDPGLYKMTASIPGTFTTAKTAIYPGSGYTAGDVINAIDWEEPTADIIKIFTSSATVQSDERLYLTAIKIEIYP